MSLISACAVQTGTNEQSVATSAARSCNWLEGYPDCRDGHLAGLTAQQLEQDAEAR
jgi:hypothetical protein